MSDSMKGLLLRLALIIGVLCAYFMTRAPFLAQPLVGEEGMFADLLARSPQGPRYSLQGRLAGQEIRDIYQHPAMMYEAYTRLGQLMWRRASASELWARLLHSLFQALLWCLIVWQGARAQGKAWLLFAALIAVGMTSPLGLAGSIHLQTDNSSGVLLAGIVALCLAGQGEGQRPWWPSALACFALSAVGKQEWSIGMVGGLLGAELLGGLLWGRDRVARSTAWASLAGVLLGQLASMAFDPANYWGGWGVLSRLGGHNVLVSSAPGFEDQIWEFRAIFLTGLVLLLVTSAVLALTAPPKTRRAELRALMVALALFMPFALSTWNPSPRYFSPAWGAVMGTLVVQIVTRSWRWRLTGALLVGALVLAYSQWRLVSAIFVSHASVTELILFDYRVEGRYQAAVAAEAKDCVPRLSTAYAWSRSMDFIGETLSLEDGAKLAEAHGLHPCPPAKAQR